MKSSSRISSLNPSRLGKLYLLKVFIYIGLQNKKVPELRINMWSHHDIIRAKILRCLELFAAHEDADGAAGEVEVTAQLVLQVPLVGVAYVLGQVAEERK